MASSAAVAVQPGGSDDKQSVATGQPLAPPHLLLAVDGEGRPGRSVSAERRKSRSTLPTCGIDPWGMALVGTGSLASR